LEYDNLRAALAWSETNGLELGLALGAGLHRYWQLRGRSHEGRAWLEQLLALAPAAVVAPAARLTAVRAAASLANTSGDAVAARRHYAEALAAAAAAHDQELVGQALHGLALAAYVENDWDEALRRYQATLAHRRAHGTPRGVAQTLNNIGVILIQLNRQAEAEPYLRESLALRESLEDQSEIAQALQNLASALGVRDPAQARPLAERSLSLRRELNIQPGMVDGLLCLGQLALAEADLERADAYLAEGLQLAQAIEDETDVWRFLLELTQATVIRARSAEGEARAAHYRRVVRLLSALERRRIDLHMPLSVGERERPPVLLAEAKAALPAEVYALELIAGAHASLTDL
jgi:tetratricopeptide (TPR) repeat protein